MKILVFSDTHRNSDFMIDAIRQHKDDTDLIVHLGDCVSDTSVLRSISPNIALLNVRGNCDFGILGTSVRDEILVPLGNTGLKAFACHGHRFAVKDDTDIIYSHARSLGARLALYGHTHIADISEKNGIFMVNPGSASLPRGLEPASYAIIRICNGEILPSIIYKR